MKRLALIFCLSIGSMVSYTQVWQPDLGNGYYRNPIINADYSDPDVCRAGDWFYMTSSSFNCVPALQILRSRDLVNWEIISAAVPDHVPGWANETPPLYGKGVWAPAIRFHAGQFYIFYGDPDLGIFKLTATHAEGPWEETLVMPGKGYIDPCPLWDEDGRVWLVHALAGSRAGLKSVLLMAELDSTASYVKVPSRIIFDGHKEHPTCEGPKLYKRDGMYYIFHPAGGVRTGWQTVLRSEHIYGPYEAKIVLRQGKTEVNGPHQGAWVTDAAGADWFIHFQDKGLYGRVVHLQPMEWKNGWPIMGRQGEPVTQWKKPAALAPVTHPTVPATSDEFDDKVLGGQWQWMATPQPSWYFCDATEGLLRLYSVVPSVTGTESPQWEDIPNLLMQKLPADTFIVTTKVRFNPDTRYIGERAGLVFSADKFLSLTLISMANGIYLSTGEGEGLQIRKDEWVWLRMSFLYDGTDARCTFSASTDGKRFRQIGPTFFPKQQKDAWIGSKIGLFCTRPVSSKKPTNDGGWLDIDWWRITR